MHFLAVASIASNNVQNLLKWVASEPGAALGPLRFDTSKAGAGCGSFSTRALMDGEMLITLPASALLTAKGMSSFQDEWGERAALASVIARETLSPSSPCTAAYCACLPNCPSDQLHMLWWSPAQVAMLAGTSAEAECNSLRDEVDDVCTRLSEGLELDVQYKAFGKDKVHDAVRAGYVSVLSRAFNFDKEGRELALIPVLDLLQHGNTPSVGCSFEINDADGETYLVARAIGHHPKNTELTITYGAHPAFVFATHYGFVPPLDDQRASCYTVLRMLEADEDLINSAGSQVVLAAQGVVDEGSIDGEETWTAEGVRAEPARALAALLDSSSSTTETPLRFGVSTESLDTLAGIEAATRAGGDKTTVASELLQPLLTAARLCALRDDDSGSSEEAQATAATTEILLTGSLDKLNDVNAALLVVAAARAQLAILCEAEKLACATLEASTAPISGSLSAACVEMAKALRDNERVVLGRLSSGGDAGRLFGIDNWAALMGEDEDADVRGG